jgi:hypothetical protein
MPGAKNATRAISSSYMIRRKKIVHDKSRLKDLTGVAAPARGEQDLRLRGARRRLWRGLRPKLQGSRSGEAANHPQPGACAPQRRDPKLRSAERESDQPNSPPSQESFSLKLDSPRDKSRVIFVGGAFYSKYCRKFAETRARNENHEENSGDRRRRLYRLGCHARNYSE